MQPENLSWVALVLILIALPVAAGERSKADYVFDPFFQHSPSLTLSPSETNLIHELEGRLRDASPGDASMACMEPHWLDNRAPGPRKSDGNYETAIESECLIKLSLASTDYPIQIPDEHLLEHQLGATRLLSGPSPITGKPYPEFRGYQIETSKMIPEDAAKPTEKLKIFQIVSDVTVHSRSDGTLELHSASSAISTDHSKLKYVKDVVYEIQVGWVGGTQPAELVTIMRSWTANARPGGRAFDIALGWKVNQASLANFEKLRDHSLQNFEETLASPGSHPKGHAN